MHVIIRPLHADAVWTDALMVPTQIGSGVGVVGAWAPAHPDAWPQLLDPDGLPPAERPAHRDLPHLEPQAEGMVEPVRLPGIQAMRG